MQEVSKVCAHQTIDCLVSEQFKDNIVLNLELEFVGGGYVVPRFGVREDLCS